MGASGGIYITPVNAMRKRWDEIRKFYVDLYTKQSATYAGSLWYVEMLEKANNLPTDVSDLNDGDFVKLMHTMLSSYDTPYLHDNGDVIMAEGSNVDGDFDTFSNWFGNIFIQTWS